MYLLQCHPPIRSSIKYNTQAKRLWSIHICIDSPTEELMNKNVIFFELCRTPISSLFSTRWGFLLVVVLPTSLVLSWGKIKYFLKCHFSSLRIVPALSSLLLLVIYLDLFQFTFELRTDNTLSYSPSKQTNHFLIVHLSGKHHATCEGFIPSWTTTIRRKKNSQWMERQLPQLNEFKPLVSTDFEPRFLLNCSDITPKLVSLNPFPTIVLLWSQKCSCKRDEIRISNDKDFGSPAPNRAQKESFNELGFE